MVTKRDTAYPYTQCLRGTWRWRTDDDSVQDIIKSYISVRRSSGPRELILFLLCTGGRTLCTGSDIFTLQEVCRGYHDSIVLMRLYLITYFVTIVAYY